MDKTILIVDDSTFIKDGLVSIFYRNGYHTISASGGDECLEILKTTIPDIILLDILMEPMDGWETLNRLKANPATAAIPVLIFSAKKITPSEALEHSKDIDGYVAKPVTPVQLLNAIQQILNRRNDEHVEFFVAPGTDLDKTKIDDCTSIPASIEVDRELLAVLKNSGAICTPGQVTPAEDIAAMQVLEDEVNRVPQGMNKPGESGAFPQNPAVNAPGPAKPATIHPANAPQPIPAAQPVAMQPGTPEIPVTPLPVSRPAPSAPGTPKAVPVTREIPILPYYYSGPDPAHDNALRVTPVEKPAPEPVIQPQATMEKPVPPASVPGNTGPRAPPVQKNEPVQESVPDAAGKEKASEEHKLPSGNNIPAAEKPPAPKRIPLPPVPPKKPVPARAAQQSPENPGARQDTLSVSHHHTKEPEPEPSQPKTAIIAVVVIVILGIAIGAFFLFT